ncbi:MAG: DNA cytosine methyltransferase [Acidobacteriota bacterium]
MRVLELFCGIGGCAAALGSSAEVVGALDVNRLALEVYRHNFDHPVHPVLIEALDEMFLRRFEADLWWLSPPCQPYTRRGLGRDLEDPRARSFRHLLRLLPTVRPTFLALENVLPFRDSEARRRLLAVLEEGGYAVAELILCPSSLGVPNRRPRYFLAASREGRLRAPALGSRSSRRPLRHYLGRDRSELAVDRALLATYNHALDIVDAGDSHALTACFTSGYGRSFVRSGSYVRTAHGVRRFSPDEILRLLGFDERFRWPETLTLRQRWKLAGNSVSLDCVRVVLAMIGLELDR